MTSYLKHKVKQCDELSIHLGRVFLITILVVLVKIVLGVVHLLRIHEVCPECVLLVLDVDILELELGLTVLQFICNFVDPFLREFGEVCRHVIRSSFRGDRHRRDSDLEMVTDNVNVFDKPCPILFISQSTTVVLESLPVLNLSIEWCETLRSPNVKQHKDMGCRVLTTEMITLPGV
jgi:hypothetical protein